MKSEKTQKNIKIGIFIASMLFFQVFIVTLISIKAFISYEVLNNPKIVSYCAEMDYECVGKCDEVDDFSYSRGATRRCDLDQMERICCVKREYVQLNLIQIIRHELSYWVPLTALGIGIAFGIFATGYISKKYL